MNPEFPAPGTPLAPISNDTNVKSRAKIGRLAMVIERMDGFAALGRQLLDKFQGSSPSEPRVDAPVENGHSKGGDGQRPTVDKAEISPQAHRLIALRQVMDSGLQALAKEPDVRPDRVAEARSRLNQGFYNSMDVRSRVAERLDEVARHLEDI